MIQGPNTASSDQPQFWGVDSCLTPASGQCKMPAMGPNAQLERGRAVAAAEL